MDTNKTIGVIGGGVEGMALVHYFQQKGCTKIRLFNQGDRLEEAVPESVEVVLGSDAFEKVEGCDVLFRSPGVHPAKLEKAQRLGITITSTTQFFLENCPCPVIGVTGTKGKGTTSTLIYLMLKEAGFNAYLGGNIGESPLNFLDDLAAADRVVLELSSFQLQDITISPHLAVVLMTTSEHLDYHKDQQEYWEAKMPLLRFQTHHDFAILNADYSYATVFETIGEGQKFFISRNHVVSAGAYVEKEAFYWNNFYAERELLGDVNQVALLGKHNLENILAALAVGKILNLSLDAMQKVIATFSGLPHRLEFIIEKNGVKYYNDSFSTTPETSIAASYAFEDKGPVILIAGGSEKNADYSEWAEKLSSNPNLKAVLLMGVTADRMEKLLRVKGFNRKVIRCESLEQAIDYSTTICEKGDNVVLSPAAASFDMFKNYKDRGEKFRRMVRRVGLK